MASPPTSRPASAGASKPEAWPFSVTLSRQPASLDAIRPAAHGLKRAFRQVMKISPQSCSLFACLAAAVALAPACKKESKEDKVRGVCEKMYKEDVAKCGGDEACTTAAAGMRESCLGLAKTVGNAEKRPSMASQIDEAKGKCDKGDQEECSKYGAAVMLGKVPGQEPSVGFALVSKSCESGNANGCEMTGRAYDKGLSVAVDKAKYYEYMKKACDMGSGGGCRSFALSFESTDPQRIPYLETACAKSDQIGCIGAGAAFMHGQGTAIDKAKAKGFFQKACDLKATDTKSCELAKSL